MRITRVLSAAVVALTLAVPAPSYAEEGYEHVNTGDAGAIVVHLQTLRERLDGSCHFVTFGTLDSNVDNVVLTGVATVTSLVASPGEAAVSAGINCLAFNRFGEVAFSLALPGPSVVGVTPGSVRKSPFTVCAQVVLHRLNNSVVTTEMLCGEPEPPIG